MVTVSIIDPPVRNGGAADNSSPRPYSTPTPLGPNILCPENAAKSTSSAWKSTDRCGTDWHASSTVSAPTALARLTSSPTGACAPVTLAWWLKATSLTLSSSCSESRSMRPSSVTPYQRNVAPVRRASSCHGTRLAWCSSSVVTITSPGPTARSKRLSPSTYDTRLSASVAVLVNTNSSASAPTKAATSERPCS